MAHPGYHSVAHTYFQGLVALLTFLSSGEWRDVIDETGLSISDRVAVALLALNDASLRSTLQDLTAEAVATADLSGIVLFGLHEAGLDLLSRYCDRTVDIQTVALVVSFIPPTLPPDRRIERWIQIYRSQLDDKQLYRERAMFDRARGLRVREEMENLRNVGRKDESKLIGARLAQPQILLRCLFCSTTIAPSVGGQAESYSVKVSR